MRPLRSIAAVLLLASTAFLQTGCPASDVAALSEAFGPFEVGSELNDALDIDYRAFEQGSDYRGVRFSALLPDGQSHLEILLTPMRLKDGEFTAVQVQADQETLIQTGAAFFGGTIEADALGGATPAPEDFARFALRRNAAGNRVFEGVLVHLGMTYEFKHEEAGPSTARLKPVDMADNTLAASGSCGVEGAVGAFAPSQIQDPTAATEPMPRGAEALIALAGDAELLAQQGGSPSATADYMLSRFHLVTGFYQAQFQVTLRVPNVVIAADPGAISPSTAPVTVLNDLSEWGSRRFAGATHIALVHLYTGRALTGSTLGIARINALCSTARVGLSRSMPDWPYTMSSVTAHELGHNFSMLHDTDCSDAFEDKYLMCPYSTQTRPRVSRSGRQAAEQAISVALENGCFAPAI